MGNYGIILSLLGKAGMGGEKGQGNAEAKREFH